MLLMGGPEFFVYTTGISSSGEGGTITASVQYQSDGDIQISTTDGTSDVGDWIKPKTLAPGSYTIRAHVNSGTLAGSSSAVDSDLALSSSRAWAVERASTGTTTANVTFTIKDGGGNTLKTGTVDISSTRTD